VNGGDDHEDVLAGPVPPLSAPRTRFNRPVDYAVLGLIVVALVATGIVVWRVSDLRSTTNTTSSETYDPLVAPEFFPPSLGEAWRAESPATQQPIVIGPTVVTGKDGEVTGRDPQTGDVRWSYRRDLPLCTISAEWGKVIALHQTAGNALPSDDSRSAGGCSEMVELDPTSGKRGRQRNFDAEADTRLLSDGIYMTATGARLLDTIRFDLVETGEFGQIPAMVNPGRQPRTGCSYKSVAIAKSRVGVIERCPTDGAARLTVFKSSPKDTDKPEEITSVVLDNDHAQIVAMTESLVAVAMPDPGRVVVFGDDGAQKGNYAIDLGPTDVRAVPSGRVSPIVATNGALFYWFSGSRTIAFRGADLAPQWTINNTFGPGVVFGGRLLVPVKDAIAVIDQTDGSQVGAFPVDRGDYAGPITMNDAGPLVLEQRGATLVALR
jgi:hypothetical protein